CARGLGLTGPYFDFW
nr:immunoglobulin heavy chain junction region [Mus musculus]MBK4184310.1 immunoglobulin heavy chain junction region [Mus musculus]MBK4184311.1 immunoglobulin heavy chain junction region [Mus musculus]MBK4184312.1 immunoglobulin heavy chain junction region [Mus musculus]MBK4184313.1 immunoglobulin heavy chain junction region [Mus musculus]